MDTKGLLVDAAARAKPLRGSERPNKLRVEPAKVILCSSAKGGSAKTTTTRCVASFAARSGLRTAVIDLDAQQTLTRWWNRRPDNLPEIANYDSIPLREAGVAVADIASAGDYDVLVVDTPPGVEHEIAAIKSVIRRSDLVLIPTTDGGEDLESVSEWMALVRHEGRPAYFLLCLTDRDLTSLGEAKRYLSDKGRICPHDVRRNQAIKRSYFDGRGAADLAGKPGRRAAEDYEAVWNFVRLELGLGE